MNKKLLKIYNKALIISDEEEQKNYILTEVEKIEDELTDKDWDEVDKLADKEFQEFKKSVEAELKKQKKK